MFGIDEGSDILLVRSTDDIFSDSSQNSFEDIHLPARAETAIKSHERERLEKLVRYMAHPAISDEQRVIIEGPQAIHVKLKSRWTDGTESLLFTPSEFLERLVALIPAPKFHTTRYCGVLVSRSHKDEAS